MSGTGDSLESESQSNYASSEEDHNGSYSAAPLSLYGTQHIRGPRWAHPLILTSVFLGNQSIWSTEMAYASPFLHSLGLSKAQTALVFLAAPTSGFIVQPLVGALADHSTSSFGRRRPYIVVGTVLCSISMLTLAWSMDIAREFGATATFGITLAIFSFYVIDFSINGVVAADRALVVDMLPVEAQQDANLWISRTASLGALLGFFVGHLDLLSIPGLRLLGGTQLQILSAVVSIGLLLFHGFVASCVKERRLIRGRRNNEGKPFARSLKDTLRFVRTHTLELPPRIQRIWWSIFLSWIGWFPWMFWGSLWIGDIYKRQNGTEHGQSPEKDGRATQAASQSMMYYALVSLISSILLPLVVISSRATSAPLADSPSPSSGRSSRCLLSKVDLVTLWAFSHAVFAFCLFATIWTSTYEGACILYAISGFPSAVLHWAPHALLGEEILKGKEDKITLSEGAPLLLSDVQAEPESSRPLKATSQKSANIRDNPGIVLGIANVAVVSPQFLVIALSAAIFAIFEPKRSVIPGATRSNVLPDVKRFDSMTIIFCVGGLSALGAMYLTWTLRRPR